MLHQIIKDLLHWEMNGVNYKLILVEERLDKEVRDTIGEFDTDLPLPQKDDIIRYKSKDYRVDGVLFEYDHDYVVLFVELFE